LRPQADGRGRVEGAHIAQEYLRSGLLDEMVIHLAPLLLGDGIRLFDDLGPDRIRLVQTQVTMAPGDVRLRCRFMRKQDFHRVVNFLRPSKEACGRRLPVDRKTARAHGSSRSGVGLASAVGNCFGP
jgi:RibD C-terminal domain